MVTCIFTTQHCCVGTKELSFTHRWQIASMITILNQISTVIIEFKHRDRKLLKPNNRCISDVVWYHEFFSQQFAITKLELSYFKQIIIIIFLIIFGATSFFSQ